MLVISPIISEEKDFLELQKKIRVLFTSGIKKGAISVEEVLTALLLLGRAENYLELKTFVEIFSATFPVLNKIGEEQKENIRAGIETKVKDAVGRIIGKDPVLAVKIAKASVEPGITWEELVRRFPELEIK